MGGAYGVTLIPPLGGRLTCFHPSADLQEVHVIPIGLQVGQMVKAFRKVPISSRRVLTTAGWISVTSETVEPFVRRNSVAFD